MLTQEVKNLVNEFIDRFRTISGFDSQITLKQISCLLLMKRFEFFYQNVPETYKWSTYKNQLRDEELANFVNSSVLPFITDFLIKRDEGVYKFEELKLSNFFLENHFILMDLMNVVDIIYNKINIERDVDDQQYIHQMEGALYEHILVQTLGKDMYAKFDIQKHLSQFVVKLLDPDVFETIGDLACGTGGFLVSAYQHVITKYSFNKKIDENELEIGFDAGALNDEARQFLEDHSLFGFDSNNSMAFLSTMNLLLHGISPRIVNIDALSRRYDEFISEIKFDYIFCNPPFGAKIKKSIELRSKYGANAVELLFLLRIMESLKEGGKAAVIVPEGVLFNTTNQYLETRQYLMDTCEVEGILSFPAGLFQPYTAVKTSLLIFKKSSSKKMQGDIWFYDMKSDGYALDRGRHKLRNNPLPLIIEAWENRNKALNNDRSSDEFWVPYLEILENDYRLSLSSYKLVSQDIEPYEDPEILLEQLFSLEDTIQRNLNSLRNRL